MYIIKDWMNNEMQWDNSPYFDMDEASEAIQEHVAHEIFQNEGIDIYNHKLNEEEIDKLIDEYRGEYYVEELIEDNQEEY